MVEEAAVLWEAEGVVNPEDLAVAAGAEVEVTIDSAPIA